MFLTDYHVHSDVSQDSGASMPDMVRAEAAAGVGVTLMVWSMVAVVWLSVTVPPVMPSATATLR